MVEADLLTYLDGYNIESHCVQQEAEFAEVERKKDQVNSNVIQVEDGCIVGSSDVAGVDKTNTERRFQFQ